MIRRLDEEHTNAENEYKEQQKEKKRERDRQYYLARKEGRRRSFLELRKWKESSC